MVLVWNGASQWTPSSYAAHVPRGIRESTLGLEVYFQFPDLIKWVIRYMTTYFLNNRRSQVKLKWAPITWVWNPRNLCTEELEEDRQTSPVWDVNLLSGSCKSPWWLESHQETVTGWCLEPLCMDLPSVTFQHWGWKSRLVWSSSLWGHTGKK